MKYWFQTQPHPFRLLQITEWILLTLTVLNLSWEDFIYLPTLLNDSPAEAKQMLIPWLFTLFSLAVLGLLGLRLPTGPALSKWTYIAVQFGFILFIIIDHWPYTSLTPYLLAIRGYLIFRRLGRWIVTGLSFGLSISPLLIIPLLDNQSIPSELADHNNYLLKLPDGHYISLIVGSEIRDIVVSSLILVFTLILVNALLSERTSRQQLTAAHHQLHQYSLQIEDQAMLQERNRIAREIHDAVGHNLTALRIQLENALLFCQSDPQKTETYLQTSQQLAATALTEIRHSVSTLRSDPLQGKSLIIALETLCRKFQRQISGEFVYDLQIVAAVKSEVGVTVYRLVQEALTNVVKHSQANHITLRIQADFDVLWLMIEDDGVGFDPAQKATGFGLTSMQERAFAMGGRLSIVTAPGQGCQLSVKLPIAKEMS